MGKNFIIMPTYNRVSLARSRKTLLARYRMYKYMSSFKVNLPP